MSIIPTALSDQVSRLVSDNQQLRVKVANDETTIHLLKDQYAALAATVNGLRDRHSRDAVKRC